MDDNCLEVKKFFATVSDFEAVVISGENEMGEASSAQKNLIASLEKKLETLSSQKKIGSLASGIEEVAKSIRKTIDGINKDTNDMEQRLQLQQDYSDRLIILVFGKVNSGKSSFSNYFVSLFSTETLSKAPYFFFEHDEKKYSDEPFKVGSTETTARIQGVELGKLVLFDTPGLHSVTKENEKLTKQYTDSADLILWLTGSNSPGQTQELEELKDVLENGKVLFPVITKSDKTEEDIEVKDGEERLVSKLIMKSSNSQTSQQDDVHKRANDKLLELKLTGMDNKLHKPVSISTKYAEEYFEQEESGISELFFGLNGIYDAAIESKKENFRTQVKNHLRKVKKHLDDIEQPLNELKDILQKQKVEIKNKSDYIVPMALNAVLNKLPNLIEEHSRNKNIKELNMAINKIMLDEVDIQLDIIFEALFKLLLQSAKPPKNLGISLQSSFEDDTIDFEYKSGSRKKAITSGAGGAAGATIGFMVAGPIGGLVGGLFGGLVGNKAGEYLIETKTMTKIIGVDSSKVEAELRSELQKVIPKLVNDSIEALLNQFEPLEKMIKQSLQEIEQFNVGSK